MRIPLDYYRILGLPLAASEEQLRQSYSDRIVQLPRREYSQAAIYSRKQIIEAAYVLLSNAKERSSYNQLYLAHAYGTDGNPYQNARVGKAHQSQTDYHDIEGLGIEVPENQLVGALLILQELGEYELVLKLGHDYLISHNVPQELIHNTDADGLSNGDYYDIILTVALACLELGREQWQQGRYESAAISLQTGQELLSQRSLFVNVQAEMQADIYKLRPYRILELLAMPEEKVAERSQGLALLREILSDRGGIDGTGNDYSGLNIDDFLRFIQQLRLHLTVAEQHQLFARESRRPCAVANYLAVYASIARGFVQHEPALIRQAKEILMTLGRRQDVHLEQSLCALLLGQTEEATRVLELSQEYEALAFIREKSLNSPDLLPGLCLYAESWLKHEVFANFRDLVHQTASLKDYFAHPQVQAYLETLPTDAKTTDDWTVFNRQSFSQFPLQSDYYPFVSQQLYHNDSPQPQRQEVPTDETAANVPAPGVISGNPSESSPPLSKPKVGVRKRRRRKPKHLLRSQNSMRGKKPLLVFVFLCLVGIITTWLIVSTALGWVSNLLFPPPVLEGKPLNIQINQPPVVIPDKNSKLLLPSNLSGSPVGSLTKEKAKEVIQTWLSAKSAALGPNYDIDGLQEILTGSILSMWRGVAQQEKAKNSYRRYDHTVNIESVNLNADKSVLLVAKVREITQFYEQGTMKRVSDETLRVQYSLVQKPNVWRIQNMSVIRQLSLNF